MGSLLLACAALFLLNCPCNALWIGTEFALSFMQNYQQNYGNPILQLHVTAVQAASTVTVEVPSLNYKQVVNIKFQTSVAITLPKTVELYGTGKSSKTVRIKASAHVAVTSSNDKDHTTDTSVIFPTSEWGKEYFIFTPSEYNNKEFAVTNGKEANTVSISLKGRVMFEGRQYSSGSLLQIALQPYESVQLQSTDDLSGTQVTSTKPVAVFTGHYCTRRFTACSHVNEQILPVSKWGKSFMVPPLSFQKKFDSVYIQASQNTKVDVPTGKGKKSYRLNKGETKEIQYHDPTTLFIEADQPIQVLLLFNGVRLGKNYHDPFLINIVPTNRFCLAYALTGLSRFDNQALIVARTNEKSKVELDGAALSNKQWKKIKGTKYSWAAISYKLTGDGHIVSSSGSPFGLYSIGLGPHNGYGAAGQCIKQGGTISCDDVTCRDNEICQMNNGFPSCVPKPNKLVDRE